MVTCQTYDAYDPIPVPMNIMYSIIKLLRSVGRKDKREEDKRDREEDKRKVKT